MKKVNLIAKFIGRDSLGYRSGEIYELRLNQTKANGYEDCPITITRLDGSGLCPYSSKESFYKSWRVIKVFNIDINESERLHN